MYRPLNVKFILPALTEANSLFYRPIKYSLFPPLGLATLAAYLAPWDRATLIDQHVEPLVIDDLPDIVVIQVYITNAYRAYRIADDYRRRGIFVALGGLHVTALPAEAAAHADAIFLGPAEESFPRFLQEFRHGRSQHTYVSKTRSLAQLPPIRRDLIKRELYLVPNSIVVSRGCPHHCDFCYKDAFFHGGRSYYTQKVDAALAEITRLPGRHLYFLDDHLLAHKRFASALFDGMQGMGRLFQGAATVDSITKGDLIERAVSAGLRSVFIGFESTNPKNLEVCDKKQNLRTSYQHAIDRLHGLGVAINGSFVFGLDHDDQDVFSRTVDWAVENGLTTATFHVATPYPGTKYYQRLQQQGRITNKNWDHYDTRQVVFKPHNMSPAELRAGYLSAYKKFYQWSSIFKSSRCHDTSTQQLRHVAYAVGWKKMEPFWNWMIRSKNVARMRPLLVNILSSAPKRESGARINKNQLNIPISTVKPLAYSR